MSNRALTLATAGLLTGLAIGIATDGVLQTSYVAPVVEPTPIMYNSGGDPDWSKEDEYTRIQRDDDEVMQLIKLTINSGVLDR